MEIWNHYFSHIYIAYTIIHYFNNNTNILFYSEESIITTFCCCSVTKLCLILHEPVDCSMPGFLVPHHVLEFAQVHVHCISDAIQ